MKVLRRVEAGQGEPGDLEQLDALCKGIFGNTFCALGDGAAMGLRAALKHFRDEFVHHIEHKRCLVEKDVEPKWGRARIDVPHEPHAGDPGMEMKAA